MENSRDELGGVGKVGVAVRFKSLDSSKDRQVAERRVSPTSPLGGI